MFPTQKFLSVRHIHAKVQVEVMLWVKEWNHGNNKQIYHIKKNIFVALGTTFCILEQKLLGYWFQLILHVVNDTMRAQQYCVSRITVKTWFIHQARFVNSRFRKPENSLCEDEKKKILRNILVWNQS